MLRSCLRRQEDGPAAGEAPRTTSWPWLTIPLGAALVAGVGLIDFVTGPEIGVSIFYVLPVAWVTWRSHRIQGGLLALVSAAVWYGNETLGGHAYSHPVIPLWNAVVRLGFFVIAVYAVERTRSALEQERRLSHTDPLTGLTNARGFYAAVAREAARARRQGSPLSICYVDLDNFKTVNDTKGHLAGDEALKGITGAMRLSVREVDVPARLGGDEFAVLMPDTGSDGARAAAERMQQAMQQAVPDAAYGVTFSMGVVTFLEAPADARAMVHQADRAMYAVKRGGKNAIRCETVAPAPRPDDSDSRATP
jgi:diguanylate cyclase (GGDEF)-like protein